MKKFDSIGLIVPSMTGIFSFQEGRGGSCIKWQNLLVTYLFAAVNFDEKLLITDPPLTSTTNWSKK